MELNKEYPGALNFINRIGLKEGENVLVLTDELSDMDTLHLFKEVLHQQCSKVDVCMLPTKLLPDFPSDICDRIKKYDVIILSASQSWYQSPTRRVAKYQYKKRVIECYNLKLEMLKEGALCADYENVSLITKKVFDLFKGKTCIRIETSQGTNFEAEIRSVSYETGNYKDPGTGGNLPAGEISIGLFKKKAHGVISFDISFDILGRLKERPLKVFIDSGSVVKVEGMLKDDFEALLAQDNRLNNIAEIGIGTNNYALLGHSVLEDEKKLGTVHIGFGNDTYFGGTMEGAHLDGVLSYPTIILDNEPLMVKGDIALGKLET